MDLPIGVVQQSLPEGTCRVTVFGEVDMTTVDRLTDALADAVGSRRTRMVVLDLQDVRFMGACGFTAIINAGAVAEQRRMIFQVENASDVVASLLHYFGAGNLVHDNSDRLPPWVRSTDDSLA
jgi:anti-anti-sigma factor